MARITKLELEQQLIASQRDNAALRTELSVLRAQLEATQLREAELANVLEHKAGLPRAAWVNSTHAEFVTAVRSDWPTVRQATKRELPAHFVAARELAMRTGRCIKVSV